jgi:hypothetical protein
LRHYFSALLLLCGLAVAPVAAHASPVTYDVVLNNVIGNTGNGTGSFTLTNTPTLLPSSYSTVNGGLTDLNFTIGGDTFDLGNAVGNFGEVDFLLDHLVSVVYAGGDISKTVAFVLQSNLLWYNFTDLGTGAHSSGYITASVDPAPTPEPATLLLFGTGMLGLAVLASRKLV